MRKNRKANQLRDLKITTSVLEHAEGSVEIQLGGTKLICSASVDPTIPKWIRRPEMGWITAEYGMLPRSTHHRIKRERALSSGRSQEISRLIGRSLRSAVNLKKLGERQIYIDCDVIGADGGTRTAAITGGYIALSLALKHLKAEVQIKEVPILHQVAAVSVGLVKGQILLDLCYEEDQQAETDMNIVYASTGELIEIQGTAEGKTFTREQLNEMLELAWQACEQIFKEQSKLETL